MIFNYKTKGTCTQEFTFDIEDNRINTISFTSGCSGNLTGIAKLLEGMDVDTAIVKLQGIQCRNGTSCPDQISKALREYKGA